MPWTGCWTMDEIRKIKIPKTFDFGEVLGIWRVNVTRGSSRYEGVLFTLNHVFSMSFDTN